MIDSLIESIDKYLKVKDDPESLEKEIDSVLDFLHEKLQEDGHAEDNGSTVFMPASGAAAELKFIRNNIFSEVCYEPDILKSLDALKSFSAFFSSTDDLCLDNDEECHDIHARLNGYFDELLTGIPENRFMTSNYQEILSAVDEYGDSGVPDILLEIVDERVKSARLLKEKYIDTTLTESEITQEFIAGNEFLLSGLELWEEALLTIEDGCRNGDNNQIQNALEKLDEANEILVVVQQHAIKVRENSI